jgi:hypothetical protein
MKTYREVVGFVLYLKLQQNLEKNENKAQKRAPNLGTLSIYVA